VSLYIPAKVGVEMDVIAERLILHYNSTASGAAATAEGSLTVNGRVTASPNGVVSGDEYRFEGLIYLVPWAETPTPV